MNSVNEYDNIIKKYYSTILGEAKKAWNICPRFCEIDDIVQVICIRIWEKYEHINKIEDIGLGMDNCTRAYIRTLAHNAAFNHIRRASKYIHEPLCENDE